MGCAVCLAPQLFLLIYLHANVGPLAPPATASPAQVLQLPSCHKSSLPQRPVSVPPTGLDECFPLTPWLSDFYRVRFSGSSGCFFFLNLLLSFFWLCEEAKCMTYASILAGSRPLLNFLNISTNFNTCVGSWSVLIDWYFSTFFSCLVIFDWIQDVVNFAWLGTGCFLSFHEYSWALF